MSITSSAIQQLASAIIKNPHLIYEEVLGQDVHTGSITLPLVYPESEKGKTVTIPFVMTGDFGFSLGNQWTTVMPDVLGEFVNGFLGMGVTGIYNALSTISGNNDSQISFQNRLASILNYKSSEKPKFNVNMTFVCTQRSYNPSEIIKTLASMALPMKFDMSHAQTLSKVIDGGSEAINNLVDKLSNIPVIKTISGATRSVISKATDAVENSPIVDVASTITEKAKELAKIAGSNVKDSFMMAPLYYQAEYDSSEGKAKARSGTVTLNIGRWFRASELVCTSISNITFSKETIAPAPDWVGQSVASTIYNSLSGDKDWGFPLYASCTVTLEPCSIVTYEDFCKYFILNNDNSVQRAAMTIEKGINKIKGVFS